MRWMAALTLWLMGQACFAVREAKTSPPPVMLWSWYMDDDFRPVAAENVGVAYLALSLELKSSGDVIPAPRLIPVRIPDTMYRMAVVRVDFDEHAPFSDMQRRMAARMIGEIAALAHARAVQIDFDAPRSAWPFYRGLIHETRRRLGADVFLSMTALVSWCESAGSWMSDLPVDEIVPMAFYMGLESDRIVSFLRSGGQFAFAGCRTSIGAYLAPNAGTSIVRPRNGQRAYFFHNWEKWTPALVREAEKDFQQ